MFALDGRSFSRLLDDQVHPAIGLGATLALNRVARILIKEPYQFLKLKPIDRLDLGQQYDHLGIV